MVTPLLTTKLYIPPPRPNLVSRPRLIKRLNAGLDRKLTLISAPAGFGKTTLVSEWVAGCGRAVAWVSLDEGDNDLARFLAYFIAALQTIKADIGEGALSVLQSPQPPPMEAVLTALINEIVAIPDPLILVLDDYHLIAAQPIHDTITFLLDHLPDNMHLTIATRADPPLPLARLRGRGQMTELRAADLRFTLYECAAFLNQVMSLNLSADDVAALEARTEGWIVGLQLAALSMRGQKDTVGFIQAFTGGHRYILDYLVEEVLQRQSERVQTFLLETCILDRLTGPLCDAVRDKLATCPTADDGQATLEMLERNNLFIVALDNERRWYRYHRLFADLLRARLQQAQPDRAPTLHRRASEWYEQNGFMSEAVRHALAAEDLERAARLVEGNALQMLIRGELATLLGWLAALPGGLVRARPWLCIHHAWALTLTGQLDAVEPRLQDAVGTVHEPPLPDDILGHVAAIRAYIAAHMGNASRAIELARLALERLPEKDLVVRAVVAYTLGGTCLLSGDVVGASRAFVEASAIGQAAGNIHLAVPAICSLAGLQVEQGQLHRAAKTYRDALQLATPTPALPLQGEGEGGGPLPVAAMSYSGMGELLYEWNDLEAAARHVKQGIELSKQWGNVDTLANGYVRLARILQAQGDLDGALDALQKVDQLVREHTVTPTTAAQAATCWPRLWLAQGNIAAASRWAQESGLSVDDELGYLREIKHIALARVLIAQSQPGKAVRLLARLLKAAEVAGRMGRVIEILALQALALQAQGDTAQAMNSLERALSLAEPEGYVRVFVDEGPAMEELLRRALSRSIAPGYVSRLLAAFGEVAAPVSPVAQPLVEPLSERELEVLCLVAAGLSNREIAQELVIAVSTVKSHANHIFGKLGVKNRTQAVAQAKVLNLL